jgi:hypothetical protein
MNYSNERECITLQCFQIIFKILQLTVGYRTGAWSQIGRETFLSRTE